MARWMLALLLALPAAPAAAEARFTTAEEVRPILAATRAQWVALREFDGQDLLYFTHLAVMRCALAEVRFALNGGAEIAAPLEPCHHGTAQPNAIRGEPWIARPLGSITKVRVTVEYPDGTTDAVEFTRATMRMP